MSIIARFKRDIAKHRGRAAVLGVLFVTMVVFGVKAFFELHQPVAIAAVVATDIKPGQAHAAVNSAEAELRMNESKKLWRTLREVKATASKAEVAFAFDASYYPPPAIDPSKRVSAAPALEPEPVKPAQPVVELGSIRRQRIREQSRQLVIKTIAIGNESTPSMAIVNQQLMTLGQTILGFELTAIRPREVEFVKEGETVVVQMANGQ